MKHETSQNAKIIANHSGLRQGAPATEQCYILGLYNAVSLGQYMITQLYENKCNRTHRHLRATHVVEDSKI